jgi:branched-chain amino acid transport system permease protein
MIPARLQWPLGAAVLIVAAGLPYAFSDFTVSRILTRALILGIAAASMIFLASLSGGVSLAQMGLYGIAGYAYGNLIAAAGGVDVAIGRVPALVLAILITVGVGLVIGAISSRSEGIYFLMITLAFGIIIKLIFEKATTLSGFGGVNQITAFDFIGLPTENPEILYWVALAVSALVYVGVRYIARSPFGMALQGVRDNPARMQALGYSVTTLRTAAFAVGAFIAALAGILNVWWNTAIAPGTIDIGPIIYLLLIAVIGGLYHIEGAWIGALIYAFLDNRLRSIEFVGDRVTTAVGIIFLLIVLIAPGGIMGLIASALRRRRRPVTPGSTRSDGGGAAAAGAAGD